MQEDALNEHVKHVSSHFTQVLVMLESINSKYPSIHLQIVPKSTLLSI